MKMPETTVTPQFEVNTTHGNDAGVWICDGSGQLLSPCLLIQAVCSDQFPENISVNWKGSDSAPKSFRKTGNVPLLYGECGFLGQGQNFLHLFSAAAPIARSFEHESNLTDWQFPLRMSGIVVIFDKKSDNRAAGQFIDPFKTSLFTLNWVKAQGLPFVVAAVGYDADDPFIVQFRDRFGLSQQTPIITGPSLLNDSANEKRSRSERNVFSLFDSRKLVIKPEYARDILETLCKTAV
jgi:hypothetical protein